MDGKVIEEETMEIPDLSMEGKVAVVTGARRGIGEACAILFAAAGADVAVCDWVVESGELKAVADTIRGMGRRSLDVKTDVTQKSDVADLMGRVVDEFGTIDILINNAGTGSGTSPEPEDYEANKARGVEAMAQWQDSASILHVDEEMWDKVMSTNLKSCLLCSQAAARIMIEQKKGNIINIASVMAFGKGLSLLNPYSISKRGMVMLTEGLAADLGRYNIRVNAIGPGGIETELMRYIWAEPERLENLASQMPLSKGLIGPETCAHAALFLASDLAAYITGQTIIVDAGLSL